MFHNNQGIGHEAGTSVDKKREYTPAAVDVLGETGATLCLGENATFTRTPTGGVEESGWLNGKR